MFKFKNIICIYFENGTILKTTMENKIFLLKDNIL